MMRTFSRTFTVATAAVLLASTSSGTAVVAQTPATPADPVDRDGASEDARLTEFLDAEFAELLEQQPQLATRLGLNQGGDRWNDISDAAASAADL